MHCGHVVAGKNLQYQRIQLRPGHPRQQEGVRLSIRALAPLPNGAHHQIPGEGALGHDAADAAEQREQAAEFEAAVRAYVAQVAALEAELEAMDEQYEKREGA